MTKQDNCKECENDSLLKYADLQIDYDKAQRYIKLLEQCLDIKEQLCACYREEIDEWKNKAKLYKEKSERG